MARDARSADDCRRHAVFITMSSTEPSRTERAKVALACAWMQLLKLRKTDGHVAGLQARRASRWDEAQHDVMESGFMAARAASLA